jgi:uncharacterized protein
MIFRRVLIAVSRSAFRLFVRTFQNAAGAWNGFTAQLCASNLSSSFNVIAGRFLFNPASGEYTQQISLTNMSGQNLQGPFRIVFENLPPGVVLDNGNVNSVCAAPGAPYLTVDVPHPGEVLPPWEPVTVTANFANFSFDKISYTTAVLAAGQIP